jgi:MarR family transcriptional regulator, 2-MHQ and catechol-resistance regulon repressor
MQQLTSKTSSATQALGRLIGAHSALTRELSAQLVEEHGLTMSECEVLLLLSRAEERSLRRIDLARLVRLSPSGVTRMLDRMEATGLVGKAACEKDARVTYAVLTDAGATKLEEAWPDHVAAIERLVGERFDEEELSTLTALLDRVADPLDCEAGVSPD